MRNYILILTLIILFGCSTPKKINDYYVENKEINLFAFVGKKISVIEFDPNVEETREKVYDSVSGDTIIKRFYNMDNGYRCKYAVIKNVFNNPKVDTIDFVAYDHYGNPAFSEYETVLLYVSKSSKGNYYFHQKYQFDYLEKNIDGKFYGYTYDRKERKKRIIFKNKKIVNLEDLFTRKKEDVFKSLFNKKNGS